MLKKWKEQFYRSLSNREDYDYVREEICENNRKILFVLSAICTVIFSGLILLGLLQVGVGREDLPVFALALVCAAAMLLLIRRKGRHSYAAVMVASYLTMGAVAFYGLLISYRSPEQYTVTFIAMMCVMSMTFVDKPRRIGLAHVLVTLVCVGMVWVHKSEAIRMSDLINILSFSVLSFVGGFFTVETKVHSYVLDKRQAETLELGRRRLSAKEREALLLLTAVRSTYEMIVSVNLTRNTYTLMGDESFVTQGDAAEGCFDQVIAVHAAKVTPEHRQAYLDAFSREGLLRAWNEGKREVYLEYQQCDDRGVPHWLGTHTMFIDDPNSTDVTEITISQNIDERVRRDAEMLARLEEERDRAEQAQKAKTDFLFQMSHDIRTPMNAIIGFAGFIREADDLEVIHRDYIPKLETASRQLLMLINDALEMSRIESGKLTFRREIQDIRDIIANVMAVMEVQAEEKGVALTSDIEVRDPRVNCDQNHMNRVIMNLVSNAVKFTPRGGRVTVSLRQLPDTPEGRSAFRLQVADTGIGMSPAFLEKVFEPFEREQTSTVSGMQGTGLGLAIVKRIVETAGDRITVESAPGRGTVFTLELALLRAGPEDIPAREKQAPAPEEMREYFRGRRILLVEDNEFNLAIAQTLLENAGFAVDTAGNGRAAVERVAQAPAPQYYDAILMDVQMPVMDGYQATRAIRALEDSRAQTVIIAVTANAFDTDRDNAAAAGMNGHIAKPMDVAVLYSTLWELLRKN